MAIVRVTNLGTAPQFVWPGALLGDCGEPSWERIASVIRAANDRGAIYLVGGEPMARSDIGSGLSLLAEEFPHRDLVLLGNGLLFGVDQACRELGKLGNAAVVAEVVIASTRADVNDHTLGVAGILHTATQAVRKLLALRLRARVRVLVGRHNLTHLHEITAHLPDIFPELEQVVWDVASLAADQERQLGVRPDHAASYLESALNLGRGRNPRATVIGMPACAIRDEEHASLEVPARGWFPNQCNDCMLRQACSGVSTPWIVEQGFQVQPFTPPPPTPPAYAPRVLKIGQPQAPVGAPESGEPQETRAVPRQALRKQAEYEAYLLRLLAHYVPLEAHAAASVLDAMCGGAFPNLAGLRRFFARATIVLGVDNEVNEASKPPEGTTLLHADLHSPLPTTVTFDFAALFKPPGDQVASQLESAIGHIGNSLRLGGHLLIVLAEHTDVARMLAILEKLGLHLVVSELNAWRDACEPEHKWIILCRR